MPHSTLYPTLSLKPVPESHRQVQAFQALAVWIPCLVPAINAALSSPATHVNRLALPQVDELLVSGGKYDLDSYRWIGNLDDKFS